METASTVSSSSSRDSSGKGHHHSLTPHCNQPQPRPHQQQQQQHSLTSLYSLPCLCAVCVAWLVVLLCGGCAEVVTVGEDQLSVRVLGRADGPGGSAPFSSSSSSSSPPSPASALQLSELWRVSVSASSSSPLSFLSGVVKLHAGYLDPYELHRNRAQVLVAVTAGGEVLCIDAAQRALLWRRRLTAGGGESGHGEADDTAEAGGEGQSATESGARLSSSEVSVLINPHPMRLNDSGVVVVGVRVRPSQHFSHFAFSGRSGQPRWRHDTNDFLSSQHSTRTAASNPSSSSSPSSMSSADVVLHEAHEVHSGEVEWRNYRSAFLSALPHQWLSPSDTSLQLAQVSPPQRQGQLGVKDAEAARASSSRRAAASLSASLPSASLLSVPAASALWAHDDAEHLAHPNALFAHTREGVELLSFYTGRPLAHLPLQPGQAHADLNADGVIDHLQILNGAAAKREGEGGGGEGGEDPAMPFAASAWLSAFSPCSAVVSSGVPPVSPLFNVSLCGGALERLLFRGLSAVSSRTMRRGRGNRGGPGGVGGIPWTQSMQGRRHLRLQPTAGGATAGPAGRRRPPRRRPPHPLASAATDDGASAELLSQREDDTQEGAAAAAAEGGGAEAGEEEQLEQAMDVGEEEDASEWVSAPLQLPAVRHSPAEGAASPAGLVSYFLSSHGLVTAVDGRGRKLFATHTAAALSAHSSADSAAATPHHRSSHHHILPYHVKRDEAQVVTPLAHAPHARAAPSPLASSRPCNPLPVSCWCVCRSACCCWVLPPWWCSTARMAGCLPQPLDCNSPRPHIRLLLLSLALPPPRRLLCSRLRRSVMWMVTGMRMCWCRHPMAPCRCSPSPRTSEPPSFLSCSPRSHSHSQPWQQRTSHSHTPHTHDTRCTPCWHTHTYSAEHTTREHTRHSTAVYATEREQGHCGVALVADGGIAAVAVLSAHGQSEGWCGLAGARGGSCCRSCCAAVRAGCGVGAVGAVGR